MSNSHFPESEAQVIDAVAILGGASLGSANPLSMMFGAQADRPKSAAARVATRRRSRLLTMEETPQGVNNIVSESDYIAVQPMPL